MADKDRTDIRKGAQGSPDSLANKWRLAVPVFIALIVLVMILFATLEFDPWHLLD